MKNLIIITSVINISDNPLSYTNIRSVFNYNERLEQTIKTINSLNKIKNIDIVLVETSKIIKSDEELLKSKVNYYFNFNSDENIKNIVDSSFKGSGEAIQILRVLELIDINQYDNIIKISGRYWLNENFDENCFNNNLTMFKESDDNQSLSTVIYKINKRDYIPYIETLKHVISSNQMIERIFKLKFNKKYEPITKSFGVIGYVSVNGVLWEI